MESDWKGDEGKREYIQKIILNRGRRVDLHRYLMKHPDELLKGVLVAGSVGSGKTERSISIVRSALDSGYGVVVFDSSNDYQRLLHEYEEGVVIDFNEFYQNPIEPPPGMTLEEWSPIFIQVFAQIFGLKDPSIAILQNSMNNLISKLQVENPILGELLEEVVQFLPRSHSSETSSHASVQNRLESVLASEWSRCLDVRRGFSPEDFEDGLLIIKLRPAGIERVHEFVVGLTIAKIFAYRSWKQNLGDSLGKNVLVVIEEAHRFLSEGRQGDRRGQTLFLERALVEPRKLGVGFVTVDQMPHRISDYVLGSCSLWIVCRLMDPNSRRMVGEALRTDVVWSHIGLMELPVGGAIIRVENQRELEDTSPMAHRDEKFLYDVKGLPATVALPANPENLLPSIDSKTVWEMMVKNERYMRYFERVLKQDYHKIRNTLQESEKEEFRRFIDRILGNESEISIISEHHEFPSPLDRYQIDECARLIGILSSKNQVRILKVLIDSEARATRLAEAVSKSPSWISRTIGNMISSGVIQKKSGIYSISPRGWTLLRWTQSVCQESEIADYESISVCQEASELGWLLSKISGYREFKEIMTIAGHRGTQDSLDRIRRVEYLLRFILERDKVDLASFEGINSDLFQLLKTSLEGGVLSYLLTRRRPVLLSHIIGNSKVGERSVRRHLELLSKHGVITRIWHDGQKGVRLQAAWWSLLEQLVSNDENRIAVPVSLLQRIFDIVKDSILQEWLLKGETSSYHWEKHRTILAKMFQKVNH